MALATVAAGSSPADALHNCGVSEADLAVDAEEQELLALLNDYRVANGRNALSSALVVTRAAAWFSRDMAAKNYTSTDHVDSLNRPPAQRLENCFANVTQFAESLYWGSGDGRTAFDRWRSSPSDDANLLVTGVTHAGVARAFDASSTFGWYWALDLTAGEPLATLSGATFYSDGTSSRAGPSGARVSVFATRAEQTYEYQLVSGRVTGTGRPCTVEVMPISATARFSNAQGVISQTAGTLDRPPGQWEICFLAEGRVVTGAATYTVTG